MSVGSNIRKRRFELNISQQELATMMGYRTRSTIAKIESGENDVSQKKLQKFAAVLDTTVEMLISGVAADKTSSLYVPSASASNAHRTAAIILAGGRIGRTRQNIPTQFVSVFGKPIIVHCMEVYQQHPAVDDIYVVCLKGWENIVEAYAKQYNINKLKKLIPGGNSGTASLKNAIDQIKEFYKSDDIIIIQESTRPMVSPETVSQLLQACAEKGSATICHSMNEYVQFQVVDNKAHYVDRNTLVAMQSPEAHRFCLLEELFGRVAAEDYPLADSCCTMLLHHFGYNINFVEGNTNNIKIVRDEDISTFKALLHQAE